MVESTAEARLLAQGNELKEEGDLAGAESALREAAEGDDRDVSPIASLRLGELLYEKGDAEGAAFEWHVAAQSRVAEISTAAVIHYGRLISECEFKSASETVVGTNRVAPLIGGFDAPKAEQMWLDAARSGQEGAAWGWIGVGRVRAEEEGSPSQGTGDPEGARAAYREAADSGHPDAGPFGLLKLGLHRRNLGEPQQAIEPLEQCFAAEHPEWSPRSAWFLGLIYAGLGQRTDAERWWRIAVDSGHPGAAEPAQQALTDPDSIFRAGIRRKRGLGRLLGG